ncbi:glycosyltransferase [Clostridium sp. YIM B02569]|uniref:glycosyltransferase n=1 Tax=Clostridium sp. YIM B02569 TaxID=2911967 RepID=UPI001EEA728E|nr:glycosyltransferase [Clostridium sp. YIM B02569]
MNNEKLSFVIPCYGSENTIKDVIEEIITTIGSKNKYEIICVNDCSPDNVLSVLKELAFSNNNIKVIDLAKNSGKHSAMMAGYRYCSGDVIINLDDDGQCPAYRLYELVEVLHNEYDVAMAHYGVKNQSAFKNFGSKFNDLTVDYLLDKPKDIQITNFSAFKKFVVDEIIRYENPYPYVEGLMLRTTLNIKNISMENRDRLEGKSNFTLKKMVSLWLNGFTAFSVKPLRISTVLGIISSLVGFIYGIWIVIKKLFVDPSLPIGYSSIMAAIMFIGGELMLVLGLIGEYIGRIYISINNAPQYVVRETVNVNKDKNKKELDKVYEI